MLQSSATENIWHTFAEFLVFSYQIFAWEDKRKWLEKFKRKRKSKNKYLTFSFSLNQVQQQKKNFQSLSNERRFNFNVIQKLINERESIRRESSRWSPEIAVGNIAVGIVKCASPSTPKLASPTHPQVTNYSKKVWKAKSREQELRQHQEARWSKKNRGRKPMCAQITR